MMPNGIAFSLSVRDWRLGFSDAIDDQHPNAAPGRPVVVGRWLCLGPVAICWDYE